MAIKVNGSYVGGQNGEWGYLSGGEYTDMVFILARSGVNSAWWPNRVYGMHSHKNYRLWTR